MASTTSATSTATICVYSKGFNNASTHLMVKRICGSEPVHKTTGGSDHTGGADRGGGCADRGGGGARGERGGGGGWGGRGPPSPPGNGRPVRIVAGSPPR